MQILWGKRWLIPITIAAGIIAFFIYYSSRLTHELSLQEKERILLWADATHTLISPATNNIDFPLEFIEKNNNIPVVLTDSQHNVIFYRNIDAPNEIKLENKISNLIKHGKSITLNFDNEASQIIYYEDSTLLKNLSFYPWIQIALIFAFIILIVITIGSTQKWERNKLWLGLTKETAHQFGTPLSSLQGWIEYLRNSNQESEVLNEMKKDIDRLSLVTSRFSKVGASPILEEGDVAKIVSQTIDYMRPRISDSVRIQFKALGNCNTMISDSLLQWVIENVIKNAVDAMKGSGDVSIEVTEHTKDIIIRIRDFGPGIPRNKRKKIFKPGYTTKERGWGVGLTLAYRIITDYHKGMIRVLDQYDNKGAVFEISLPKYIKVNKMV